MNSKATIKQTLTTAELTDLILDSISDIKGKNILKLDLRHIEDAPADCFIICEGDSNTQVKAIADNITKRVKEEGGGAPSNYEGQQNALWICLDYFDVVVHVFYRETRAFYDLEDLWSDARFTAYDSL